MKITIYSMLAIIVLSATCGACRKSTNPNSNTNVATTPAETVGGGAAQTGEKFYFRGWISDLSIEMTLLRDGERLSGTYLYPRVGKTIDLSGSVDKDGNVNLREADQTGAQTGVFKGKWKSNELGQAEIEGKWSRPDGSKETEFDVNQQPIEFTAAVRVVAKVIRETNKQSKYSVNAEYPQIEGDPRFDGFNQQARAMITKDVAAFKTSETESLDETSDLAAETLNSTLDIGYRIHLATDDLISVAFTESQYSRGAAHGSSITVVFNYDVKNRKKLALADLFNPKSNYLSVISAYSIKDLKEQGKKNDMLMEDQIQEGAAARADNYSAWTITRKGICITFDPYQVAAYAAGPQHVLVPYSALKDVIRPDGPIARFAG